MFRNVSFILVFLAFLAGCASTEQAEPAQNPTPAADKNDGVAPSAPAPTAPNPTPAADKNDGAAPSAPAAKLPDVREMKFQPLEVKITKPESFKLKNGIRVFYMYDDELPLMRLTAMMRFGSVYDPKGKAGAANMLATMMRFGGTESYAPAEIDAELEFVCADMSVECGRESGTAKLVVTKKDFDLGLKIFFETVAKPRLDAERMKLVAAQTALGARRKMQDPETVAGYAARILLYGKHPYGTHHEGLPASIQRITREDLADMHTAFLSPENIVIAASGDIERGELEKKLNETFGAIKKSAKTLPAVPPLEYADKSQVLLANNPTISQTTIFMVTTGHKRHDPDRMKCMMLSHLLSKRLNEEVRDKRGYAYSIYAFFNAFDEGGMFAAVTQTKPKSTADSIRIMQAQIKRMMDEPVSDKDLSEARDSIINGFAFNFQSKLGICEMSASFDFFGFPENYIEQYYNEMRTMTAVDLQMTAKKFLKPDKLRIVVVANKEQLSEPLNTFSDDYRETQWKQGAPPELDLSDANQSKQSYVLSWQHNSRHYDAVKKELNELHQEIENISPDKYPETPGEVVRKMANCYQTEDAKTALELMAEETIKQAANDIRSDAETWNSLGLPDSDKNNDRKIVLTALAGWMKVANKENFVIETIEEKIEGDKATVLNKKCKYPDKEKTLLIKENGKWKILSTGPEKD